MTTVVSRLYASAETADAVVADLKKSGVPSRTVDRIAGGDDTAATADAIAAARVGAGAAKTYAGQMTGGQVLVVARVPLVPLGAARKVQEKMDAHGPVDAGVPEKEANLYIAEKPHKVSPGVTKVLKDHPRFFSSDYVPGNNRYGGLMSDAFHIPLLIRRRRPGRSVAGWTGPMSTRFFPMQLVLRRERRKSVLENGGTVFSRTLGLALLSRRKRQLNVI